MPAIFCVYGKVKIRYNVSMENLRTLLKEQMNIDFMSAVLSGPRTKDGTAKVKVRPLMKKDTLFFQLEIFRGNQAFHKNLEPEAAAEEVLRFMQEMRQMQMDTRAASYTVLVSKKGKVTIKKKMRKEPVKMVSMSHNRKKQYVLEEGTAVPFLTDLGVMTQEGKVVHARFDKFRQINRFLEFVEDILPELPKDREVTILDFGCGKSYLTFAMYYYLHELKGYDIRIIGLDLKKDVIKNCSRLAVKYGYDKLNFYEGSIEEFEGVTQVDMVVTLHACDTATDYAMYKALRWGASVILSVPCCQHELNKQIAASEFEPITDYGILKERFCALATDGIRAKILEEQGYDTQILEFIDMEHTPKNLLIRAIHRKKQSDKKKEKAAQQVDAFCKQFGFTPTLWRLLQEEGEEGGTHDE